MLDSSDPNFMSFEEGDEPQGLRLLPARGRQLPAGHGDQAAGAQRGAQRHELGHDHGGGDRAGCGAPGPGEDHQGGEVKRS